MSPSSWSQKPHIILKMSYYNLDWVTATSFQILFYSLFFGPHHLTLWSVIGEGVLFWIAGGLE